MATLTLAKQLIKITPPAAQRNVTFAPPDELSVWQHFGYFPLPHQWTAMANRKRFAVDVWHRRGGKSVQKVLKLITRAWWCPYKIGRYAYLGPTYSQTEDIIWGYVSQLAEVIPGATKLDGKLTLTIPTRIGSTARIRLYGVDSPKQRLRGAYLDGVVLDEFQDIPEHVWTEQVRPMLADESRRTIDAMGHPNQWADFVGTPRGRNQLYRFHRRATLWGQGLPVMVSPEPGHAEEPTFSDLWSASLEPVSKTQAINSRELADMRADMGTNKYLQEMECSFDAAVEGSVYGAELAHLLKLNHVGRVPLNPNEPVNTAWDLGWDDYTAIWFFQHAGPQEFRFIDYMQVHNASIPRLRHLLAEKEYSYGYHLLPWDVAVHELGEGKSRQQLFQQNGIRVTPVVKHNTWDGIAATRAALPYCYFDEIACQKGLDALALYQRKKDPQTGMFSEEPDHDENSHAADAIRSFAVGRKRGFRTTAPQAVGQF